MSSDWPEAPLEDLKANEKSAFAMGPFGSNIKAENFVSEGVPVIKGGNLGGTYLDESSFSFLTQQKADELSSSKARSLDIVITHRGTLGQVGLIPETARFREYIVSQSQLKMSFDTSRVDPYFVYYFLRSPIGQARLLSNTSQVGVPAIAQALTTVRKLKIPLPKLPVQREITGFLRSLDDRINLLRQTNITLESIAQALFKSWFIDFDPVRAKAEGREPEGMDATTAALFPAELEESALGLIPKGWSVKRLGEFLELVYGKALKADDRKDGAVPVYGSGGITGFHDRALVPHGSVIVGRKGTVGSLYWEDRPFFPIDTTFYVRPMAAPLTFCYYAMQRLGLESMNTDAAVPGLNRENAYRLEVVVPADAMLAAFDTVAMAIRNSVHANIRRAETLAGVRDGLLPRLISGKLRLPEAQEKLEEALA